MFIEMWIIWTAGVVIAALVGFIWFVNWSMNRVLNTVAGGFLGRR